jgi:hypothetical protein
VHVLTPGGGGQDFRGLPTPALVPAQLRGTGVYRWQVRADFSRNGSGTIPGAWSPLTSFTRTVLPPTGLRTFVSGRSLLFRWQQRPGIKSYRVEVSQRPDFARNLDSELVEGPTAAPTLYRWAGRKGGAITVYWRVAAIDADGNTGDYSPAKVLKFRPPLG